MGENGFQQLGGAIGEARIQGNDRGPGQPATCLMMNRRPTLGAPKHLAIGLQGLGINSIVLQEHGSIDLGLRRVMATEVPMQHAHLQDIVCVLAEYRQNQCSPLHVRNRSHVIAEGGCFSCLT